MPKNIVIYSDGTGQDGGMRPEQRLSNVYKMYRASRVGPDSAIDPAEQVAFYDPGLGTDTDAHGFGRAWRTIVKVLASVSGRGIGKNIADCYEFLINHWEKDDRIYIVGFSRGAYTARCVAQVISLCGVPTHEAGQPAVPFCRFSRSARKAADRAVHQVYEHGAGRPVADFEAERDEQARRFRRDFGSDDGGIANAHPYFIGVFDTVAALGAKGWKYHSLVAGFGIAGLALAAGLAGISHWVFGAPFVPFWIVAFVSGAALVWWKSRRDSLRHIDDFPEQGSPRHTHRIKWRAENYDRGLSGHVGYARQASAIDEDRADFPRVGWGRTSVVRPQVGDEPPPLVQLWFAGNHSDIGGSYEEAESRLSDVSLEWMVDEASSLPHPLLFDRIRLRIWPDHSAMQHSELFSLRDRRLWWLPKRAPAFLRDGWAAGVRKPSGSPLHPSVFARFAEETVVQPGGSARYRPAVLETDARLGDRYGGLGAPLVLPPEFAGDVLYRVGQNEFRSGGHRPAAGFMHEMGLREAALVIVAMKDGNGRDRYMEGLTLAFLDRRAEALGLATSRVEIASMEDGTLIGSGRLLPGVDEARAKDVARSIGSSVVVMISEDGSLGALPTSG